MKNVKNSIFDASSDAREAVIALTPGQQLRHAREAKNLAQDAVAKQLFVSKQLIADLEDDDYTRMGATVFARGHMVSYAKLLGLDVNPLLEKFAQYEGSLSKESCHVVNAVPSQGLKPIAMHSCQHNYWLIYAAVFVVIITLVFWGYSHYKTYKATVVTPENINITTIPSAVEQPIAARQENTEQQIEMKELPIIGTDKELAQNGEKEKFSGKESGKSKEQKGQKTNRRVGVKNTKGAALNVTASNVSANSDGEQVAPEHVSASSPVLSTTSKAADDAVNAPNVSPAPTTITSSSLSLPPEGE